MVLQTIHTENVETIHNVQCIGNLMLKKHARLMSHQLQTTLSIVSDCTKAELSFHSYADLSMYTMSSDTSHANIN